MDLTRELLQWLIANGPVTLAVVAFICALGVPLPIPVLVIAAGALVRQGHMTLATAVFVTSAGALLAETLYYALGRELGPLARTRLGPRYATVYAEAERRFNQRPGLTVYLSRWLIAPIGIPVNLIAGATRLPIARFVSFSLLGNLMWITAYTAIGYALGSEWRNVSPALDRYKLWFAGAAVVIGLLIIAYRYRHALLRGLRNALPAPRRPLPEPVEVKERMED